MLSERVRKEPVSLTLKTPGSGLLSDGCQHLFTGRFENPNKQRGDDPSKRPFNPGDFREEPVTTNGEKKEDRCQW